ncbi:unnamed protein product [Cylicostephanus goldi]|uniref:Uncharacterized protein n=1 Tax=Cylicostephanus goldi TaxID=71465 RepID=A0A3P7Q818_CYLGO|nr:unnamed protein product [Cylicostephanus goldi]
MLSRPDQRRLPALRFGTSYIRFPSSHLQVTFSYCLDICDYYAMTGQLDNHPECKRGMPEPSTTPKPVRIEFCSR